MIQNEIKPVFHIGPIAVYGDLILAPMDGYSDLPFRSVARELGSAVSYTEFVNGMDVVLGRKGIDRKLKFLEDERPIAFQLYDDNVKRLIRAAEQVMDLKPDIIDINMGCSAKKIANRGAGAGLLRDPEKIAAIFSTLSKELNVPITGKIRLGWDEDSLNYLEISKIIEDNGGSLVAVHGRTKSQAYKGQANWKAIAEIKQAVGIPVIGNGDVRKVSDIMKMKDMTGCDAVMIGRGAAKNPWIFSRLDRNQVSEVLLRKTIMNQLDRAQDFYGLERGLILFRKYVSRYLAPYEIEVPIRKQLLTADTRTKFDRLVDRIITEGKMKDAQ